MNECNAFCVGWKVQRQKKCLIYLQVSQKCSFHKWKLCQSSYFWKHFKFSLFHFFSNKFTLLIKIENYFFQINYYPFPSFLYPVASVAYPLLLVLLSIHPEQWFPTFSCSRHPYLVLQIFGGTLAGFICIKKIKEL